MTHSSSIALPILSTLHYQLFHNDFARLHNPFLKGLQALSSASSSPLSSPSCHGRTGSDSESVCLCPTHSPSASPPVGLSLETEGGVLGVSRWTDTLDCCSERWSSRRRHETAQRTQRHWTALVREHSCQRVSLQCSKLRLPPVAIGPGLPPSQRCTRSCYTQCLKERRTCGAN